MANIQNKLKIKWTRQGIGNGCSLEKETGSLIFAAHELQTIVIKLSIQYVANNCEFRLLKEKVESMDWKH